MIVQYLAVAGLLLSLYALWVEQHAKKKNYKAFCDINENISCSKAFTSKTGRTFGLHNATYGTFFYIVVFILATYFPKLIFPIAVLAVFYSVFLAYVSYVDMKNFCLVCTATYIVNISILFTSYRLL